MTRRLFVVAPLAVASIALLGAAARPFDLSDARRLVSYSAVAIAPDARHVVAVERHGDYKDDRYETALVLVDVRSHAKRVLTPERTSVASPIWSPSGDRIAFLAPGGEKKSPQIWVLPVDGGEALRITDAPRGVEGFAWRPDGAASRTRRATSRRTRRRSRRTTMRSPSRTKPGRRAPPRRPRTSG